MVAHVLLACALATVDTKCWKKYDNSFIHCLASPQTGERDKILQHCIELDDCYGVTCNSQETECTARNHKAKDNSGCVNREFLGKSDSGEVTYLKTCDLNRHDFAQIQDTELTCEEGSPDTETGTLLEKKVECARPHVECYGITCFGDNLDTTKNCSLRASSRCETQTSKKGATSFRMVDAAPGKAPPPPPGPQLGCEWDDSENKAFPCDIDPAGRVKLPVHEAKVKCEEQRKATSGTLTFCDGLTCTTNKDTGSLECLLHTYCKGKDTDELKGNDGTTVFVPSKCVGTEHCNSACYVTEEYSSRSHRCTSDCSCNSLRVCSTAGFCSDPPGVGKEELTCREGSNCKFAHYEFMYIGGSVASTSESTDLETAKKKCIELGKECVGVTCERGSDKGCTLRNHHADVTAKFLTQSEKEDSYAKCCGSDDQLKKTCPLAFKKPSSGSSSGRGWLIVLLIILVVVAGFLAYKNREMARQFHAPTEFSKLPQEGDAPENWVIDEDEDEEDRQ